MNIQSISKLSFNNSYLSFSGKQITNNVRTEAMNKNTSNIDLDSTIKMVKKINNEDRKVAKAVGKQAKNIANAIDLVSRQFLAGGKLFYFGAGTSGRLGVLDASECPPTFSVSSDMVQGIIAGGDKAIRNAVEGAEDNYSLGFEDAKVLTKNDVAVAISASGNPRYLLGVLDKAKRVGTSTIAISCNPNGEILKKVNVPICAEVGPEVLTGSSRLKAGSAQKMILNTISTGSMIKIGKTYKNLMVDLKTSNEKLKKRAVSIVSKISEVSEEEALSALWKNNWKIKESIISLKLNVGFEEAQKLLKENGGVLRKIIK